MQNCSKRKVFLAFLICILNRPVLAQGNCQDARDAQTGQSYRAVWVEKQMSGTIVADYSKCLYVVTDLYKTWLEADA